MSEMGNWISYEDILSSIPKFKRSGTYNQTDFNLFDVPGRKYFKLFFYFNNGDDENHLSIGDSGGLLAPTWLTDRTTEDNYYMYNSAWSYLKMNYEDERADLLEQFIILLSNINVESPWYFSEISGLDAAIERKQAMEKDFKFDESSRKISIKCLPDSFDDRIGTLLDLYRSIVWSWTHKRAVLPANLRKFDMGIYIFEAPTTSFHMDYIFPHLYNADDKKNYEQDLVKLVKGKDAIDFSRFTIEDSDTYKSSFKYIELHNCEIDFNSSKGNLGTLSNAEGIQPEYVIDITFDDCYESRYNEFLMRNIGDFVIQDLYGLYDSEDKNKPTISNNKSDSTELQNELTKRAQYFSGGFLNNVLDQLTGTGLNIAKGLVNKLILGNLFTISPSRLVDQVKSAQKGNVWSAVRDVEDYAEHLSSHNNGIRYVNDMGNIKSTNKNHNIADNSINYKNQIGSINASAHSIYNGNEKNEIEYTSNIGDLGKVNKVHITPYGRFDIDDVWVNDDGIDYKDNIGNLNEKKAVILDDNETIEIKKQSGIKYVNNIGRLYEANTLANNI